MTALTDLETTRLRAFAALDLSQPIEYMQGGQWLLEDNASAWRMQAIARYDWRQAPTPRRVPYTYDTFPWPSVAFVLMRHTGKVDDDIWSVRSKYKSGVDGDNWDTISLKRELSLDGGATWQPANREEQV